MTFLELENLGQRGLIQVVGFSFAKGNEGKLSSHDMGILPESRIESIN